LIYVFHDCQLNFFETLPFGTDLIRGGHGISINKTAAKNTIKINFKSISKITVPLLIDNFTKIDLREKEQIKDYSKPYTEMYIKDQDVTNNGKSSFMDKAKDRIKSKLSDVRNQVVNDLKNQVTDIASNASAAMAERFGFTVLKTNVYFDTTNQAIGKKVSEFGRFLSRGVNKAVDKITPDAFKESAAATKQASLYGSKTNINNDIKPQKGTRNTNSYTDKPENNPNSPKTPNGKDTNDTRDERGINDSFNNETNSNEKYPTTINESNIYDIVRDANGNIISLDDTQPDGVYHNKYPGYSDTPTDVYGDFNEINGVHFPSYHDKKPNEKGLISDLHLDGTYHDKKPSGDLMSGGTYHDKKPSGDLMQGGTYHDKKPEGDLHLDGTYHDKKPEGDLHSDGTYHYKQPSGNLMSSGIYHDKKPEGDLHLDGTYHDKQPDNESVQPKGTYHDKQPQGNIQVKGKYHDKQPVNESVQPKGTYHDKQPSGDLMEDSKYHDKQPENESVQSKGVYNDKKPEGTVQPLGTYHDKQPDNESLQPKGTYHDKQPNDEDIMIKKDLIPKYPKGNVYKK